MKKAFNVDDRLMKEAREACGAATDTETLKLGLEALVRHAAYQELAKLAGSEQGNGEMRDVSRRREKPALKQPTRRRTGTVA